MKSRPAHFVLWPSAILSTFVALLLSPTPASSTPLNTNISIPGPLQSAPWCTSSYDWILPDFVPQDCPSALQAFTYGDYLRYGATRFEFRNRRTPQRTPRLESMRTPRRYTIGNCTIAVAILEDSWLLPGMEGEKHFERTDSASFREIYESLRRIGLSCVTRAQTAGWEPVGRAGSLGVFMYAANSPFDSLLQLGEQMSVSKGLGNGTLDGSWSTS